MSVKHRWSPTLGDLEDSPENIWGTEKYNAYTDRELPTVFCGLYGLPDFYAMWRHKGKKYVWWSGSDIRHFDKGYFLDGKGKIKMLSSPLAEYLNEYCENWVENEVEQKLLLEWGIQSKVCPSFLGDVNKFEVSFKPSDKPKVYTSVSGNDFKLYGWDRIPRLAYEHPNIEFHLYGNTVRWEGRLPNIFVHGRVPKEQMNEEVKDMQGALRLTEFDGFSEVLAKSVLMGQWPVSVIKYPYMLSVYELGTLKDKKEPNLAGREYYLKNLNKYPWVNGK